MTLRLQDVLVISDMAKWEVFETNNPDEQIFTYLTPVGVATIGYKDYGLIDLLSAPVESIEASDNRLIITINL